MLSIINFIILLENPKSFPKSYTF